MFIKLLKSSKSISSSLRYLRVSTFRHYCKGDAKNEENIIKIGDAFKPVFLPQSPHLVPVLYMPEKPVSSLVHHLQWMMKKDVLGQDMFLIGFPGPLRRRVSLQYAEMMQREVEYVVLSRDTTENDLKQRREILNGTAHYVDQTAVRAAIEGRFLILDGVEKVERNVLPVLNNLLENREMQLEDGRFLIAPERYDKLLSEHSQQELDEWKLVRVSEDFRVIALGLPVPHFKGNPLDPPFRSRFQARHVQMNFEEQLSELSDSVKAIPVNDLKSFMLCCYTFLSKESVDLGLPKFPVENVPNAVNVLNKFPNLSFEQAFQWIYPYSLLLPKENQTSVLQTLEKFSILPQKVKAEFEVSRSEIEDPSHTHLLKINLKRSSFKSPVLGHKNYKTSSNYISNPYQDNILANLLMTHTVHDFCIIGNRGSGKATLVKKFASLLNYPVEMVMLYNEMTARDLLQQRITDENGNTLWRSSQVVQAALEGKLLVLDGLHRLHASTLSVLQRLIQDRDMQLYDGTRLLRHDRYDALKNNLKLSDSEMDEKKLKRIHPSFRIIALAEPPRLQGKKDDWMNPELLSMFLFHTLRPLSFKEEKTVIQSLAKSISKKMNSILNFTHQLRSSEDDTLRNVSSSFSTRQLVRMARRLHTFPDESVYNLITQSCLMKFLPPLTKQAVENVLEQGSIEKNIEAASLKEIQSTDGKLYIGNTSASIYDPGSGKVKVPDILFYNSQEHISVMEAMLQDFLLGEHLLLVGNQGVGKNKITDRFLQLLNRPREYIQLHRDTTVQSLTQQPTVVDGRIVYEDSPLLRAVQHGRVLVVDEADKAPTHVTSILKALVVSGEMHLSDGRCIVHHTDAKAFKNEKVVEMHPDFRMIVLANRPGFPFLGNDFFATLGDIFSCHAVDNPSPESEIKMLRQYGPDVPEYLIKKLASLFGELRSMSDNGLISYPYSIREVVNIIKHLNKFPDEGMPHALKNVFDFDSYSSEMKETLNNVFRKYGIPTENQALQVRLAEKFSLPKPTLKCVWNLENTSKVWNSKVNPLNVSENKRLYVNKEVLNMVDTRASIFTEQQSYYQLPLGVNNVPLDVITSNYSGSEFIHVATGNPLTLFSMNIDKNILMGVDLSEYFPSVRSGFKPKLKISAVDFENEESVVVYESVTNQMLLMQPTNGRFSRLSVSNLFENAISKISNTLKPRSNNPCWKICSGFPSAKKLILYDTNDSKLMLVNFESSNVYHVSTSHTISEINVLNENTLFIICQDRVLVADISNPENWNIREINNASTIGDTSNFGIELLTNKTSNKQENELLNGNEGALMSTTDDYACITLGSFLHDSSMEVKNFSRENLLSAENGKPCIFPNSHQIVRFILSEDSKTSSHTGNSYLEVVNVNDSSYSLIDIDVPHAVSSFASWLANSSKPYLLMTSSPNGKLITVDIKGCVRKWEINSHSLENSFLSWKKYAGLENEQQLTIERENKKPLSGPKHGKLDPKNAPHVGGNTWAGGTGGRDTAGLGGRGGPYRLDAGHNVFQVSDAEKASVPPEVLKAAREMGMRAYKERLKEIEMSEYDAELYQQFYANVEKQVKTLRVILDGLQAKSKERQWMRHQTSGEFDDTKLIEGITGEKSIYKRRGEQEPEMGSTQEKPKLLRLVVDVSGSMYRFNGYDNRLQREMESLVLVMEAFDGYHEKFRYEIIGHSGEEFSLMFSSFKTPPKNRKERLNLIRNMHAHSQFCMSGDHTLEATRHAIKTFTKEDADEYFVIVMSDANFDRYGISPSSFGKLLTSDPKVNAFAIFIGSLGDQAAVLSRQLPAGRAFMCLDSGDLTQILQRIFTSALLKD